MEQIFKLTPFVPTYNALCSGVKISPDAKAEFRLTILKDPSGIEDAVKIQLFVSDKEAFIDVMGVSVFVLTFTNQLNYHAFNGSGLNEGGETNHKT